MISAAILGGLAHRLNENERRELAALSAANGLVERLRTQCIAARGRISRTKCVDVPVIKFYAASGQTYFLEVSAGVPFQALHEGQSVRVLYSKSNPAASARMAGHGVGGAAALTALAAVSLMLGVAIAVVPPRKN